MVWSTSSPARRRSMTRRAGVVSSCTAVLFASLCLAAAARAEDDLAMCNGALVRGQELRRVGKLLEARAQYPTCVRASCDASLRSVCANFLAELSTRVPQVRIDVRSAGGEP